jgi:DNA-binding response OmpR family regulator
MIVSSRKALDARLREQRSSVVRGSMSTILVVDDDESMRIMLAKFLMIKNHTAILTPNGETGFEAAITHQPDVIILDIRMPGADGLDVLRQLKSTKETSSIPVIMLTGVDDEEPMKEAMYWYADQYMTKPFKEAALSAAIERALSHRIK